MSGVVGVGAPRRRRGRVPLFWVGVLLSMIAASLVLWLARPTSECHLYARDVSPDGKFAVEVCRLAPSAFAVYMPGQGDDVPGEARLVDVRTGEILRSETFEIVGSYGHAEWLDGEVILIGIADWKLGE